MTNELLQQILDFITKNAQLIGSAAFEMALRQVYYYAIADIVGGLLFLLLGTVLAETSINVYNKRMKKAWDKYNERLESGYGVSEPDGEIEDLEAMLGILGVVFGVVGVFTMFMSIRYLVNPNWYAIQLLIDQTR